MLISFSWGSVPSYLKIRELLKNEDRFNENFIPPYEGSVGHEESSFDKNDGILRTKSAVFYFSPRFNWKIFYRKKGSLECPSEHLVCRFNKLPQFFCPELQKTNFAQSHKTFENWKIHSTQKKMLSKLPLNTSFAVLRTCWLSGPKVCHRCGQALKIQKTGNFQKEQNCSSGYVKYSFKGSSSQSSKQFWKHRKKRPFKV